MPKPTNTDSQLEKNALENMGSVSNTETRKPTNTEGREAAVEELARRAHARVWPGIAWGGDGVAEYFRVRAREDLDAIELSLQASFKERVREALLSDDAVQAAARASFGIKSKPNDLQLANARTTLTAGLDAALDSEDHRG